MLFNSVEFLLYLPLVFLLYWFVAQRNLRASNLFILVASYVFYGWWDWRFLSLILLSTVVDFAVGLQLGRTTGPRSRKRWLLLSILVNLGLLGTFKYFDFFVHNLVLALENAGISADIHTLGLVLPVGISFYTFQTLSYTIDVYRNELRPTSDFIAFAAFVSFFPQLVAGPIERASHLLPQFKQRRQFELHQATDGLRQILWGLFKKMVIADNCATLVNQIFAADDLSGSTYLFGSVLFAFQIYGDFSGYSDVAIGTARLFGFQLMQNFAFPYFSRDIAEFWRRWHISLSTWFRDYLYIPLGGSRGPRSKVIRNTFLIFLISGFWHGANWTFVVWGLLNALYFMPLLLRARNRHHINIVAEDKRWPSFNELLQILLTFFLTCLAWVFFRADSVAHAVTILGSIGSGSLFTVPEHLRGSILAFISFLIVVEWWGRRGLHALQRVTELPRAVAMLGYIILIGVILIYGGAEQDFIYFQF